MNKNSKSGFWTKYSMVITAVALFAFFVMVVVMADKIQILVKSTSVDARFWPRIVGYAGCLFSAILFVQSILEAKFNTSIASTEEEKDPGENKRAMQSLALIFFYILGLQYVGFFFSTVVYLFGQFTISADKEKRNPKKFFILALIFSIFVYVVFRYLFRLMLPSGSLWDYI